MTVRRVRFRRVGAIGVLAVLASAAPLRAAEPFSGEIVVILEGAMVQFYHKGSDRPRTDLELYAVCTDGKWQEAWSEARLYNKARHEVKQIGGEVTAERMKLKVEVQVNPDGWVSGGQAAYEIDLKRSPSSGPLRVRHLVLRSAGIRDELHGTYAGTLRQHGAAPFPGTGTAVGIVLPSRKAPEGFAMPISDERPRLLLRKGELPALRDKARTPLGRAICERLAASDDLIAKGLMYQITGEARYAAAAVPTRRQMLPPSPGPHVAGRLTAFCLWRVAITYDLCCRAWDPQDRQTVREYLARWGQVGLAEPDNLGRGLNQSPGYYGNVANAGGGMAALALWGEPGPAPPEPRQGGLVYLLKARTAGLDPDAAYERARDEWIADYARWKQRGGANMEYLRLADFGRQRNVVMNLLSMGEWSFSLSHGYAGGTYYVPHDFAIAYQNVFGRGVTGRPVVSHFLPRYLVTTAWHDAPDPAGGLRYHPVAQGFAGDGTMGPTFVARAMRLAPREWLPALVWFMLRTWGVTAEEARTEAGARKIVGHPSMRDPTALVPTLLYYPLDVEPVNPREVMPRVWESYGGELVCFRNDWVGRDSIVAQVHAHAGMRHAETGGSFLINGLGHLWAVTSSGYGRNRALHNVVLMPADSLQTWGEGRIVHHQADPRTGSGVVTIDMNENYKGYRRYQVERTVVQRNRDIIINRPVKQWLEEFADVGIKGLRSFGVDYSGQAGVPAVIVVVDHVTGGGEKLWNLHYPGPDRRRGARQGGAAPAVAVGIDGNAFTLVQGAASMKVSFASPAGAKIRAVNEVIPVSGVGKSGRYTMPWPVNAIRVSGADGRDGLFFAVMTLQRGQAPAVRITGSGLKTRATVGGRTISFDGEKIVFN